MSTPKWYIMTLHHKLMRSTSIRGSEEELSFSVAYVYTTMTFQGGSIAQQLLKLSLKGDGLGVHAQQHESHLLKLSPSV